MKSACYIRRAMLALPAGLAILLAGCHAVGPDYHTPPVPQPASWHTEGPWRQGEPKDQIPKGAWWEIFHDAELNRQP